MKDNQATNTVMICYDYFCALGHDCFVIWSHVLKKKLCCVA